MSAKLHYTPYPEVIEAFQEARRALGDRFVDQALRAAKLGLQPEPYLVLDDSGSSRKLVVVFPDVVSPVSGSSNMGSFSAS